MRHLYNRKIKHPQNERQHKAAKQKNRNICQMRAFHEVETKKHQQKINHNPSTQHTDRAYTGNLLARPAYTKKNNPAANWTPFHQRTDNDLPTRIATN